MNCASCLWLLFDLCGAVAIICVKDIAAGAPHHCGFVVVCCFIRSNFICSVVYVLVCPVMRCSFIHTCQPNSMLTFATSGILLKHALFAIISISLLRCCSGVNTAPFFLSECAFTWISWRRSFQWLYSSSSRSHTSLSLCAYQLENVFHLIFPNDVITPWQSVCHSIFPLYSCCRKNVHAANSPHSSMKCPDFVSGCSGMRFLNRYATVFLNCLATFTTVRDLLGIVAIACLSCVSLAGM